MALTEVKDVYGVAAKGILVPADWDESGNIIAMALSTYSEEEYIVKPNQRGQELFAFLHRKVEIQGFVKMDDCGRKIVTVEQYEVLEE